MAAVFITIINCKGLAALDVIEVEVALGIFKAFVVNIIIALEMGLLVNYKFFICYCPFTTAVLKHILFSFQFPSFF